MYDHLSIPCLAVMSVFENAQEVSGNIQKYFTFDIHIFSFISMTT